MKFKKFYAILLLAFVGFGCLFFSCKAKNNFKSDAERSIPIDLSYTFKEKKAEQLSIEAFELQKNKDYSQAINLYRQAIKVEPDNPKLFFDISNCYANTENWNEAIFMLDTAIALDRLNPAFYSNRGFYFWKLYKDQNAIDNYKKAISLDSTNWTFYSNLSIAYYTVKKEGEACKMFKIAQTLGLTTTTINSDRYLKKVEDLCE
jgi:tetratricopeptide (TPR) repeat protein